MQAAEKFLTEIENVFSTEHPELTVIRATSEDPNPSEADWVLIPANYPVKKWNVFSSKTRFLSLLLPDEYASSGKEARLPASIASRWYWIPPLAPSATDKQATEKRKPEYLESELHPTIGSFQLLTQTEGLKASAGCPDPSDIIEEHLTYLGAQNQGSLLLSNRERIGSPLRYLSTHCHFPAFALAITSGLKSAYAYLKRESEQFESDLARIPHDGNQDTLASRIATIVSKSGKDRLEPVDELPTWQSLAFPQLRETPLDAAVVEAHNTRKAVESPVDPEKLKQAPFSKWACTNDNALALLRFVNQQAPQRVSNNLIHLLCYWLTMRPSSRAWKSDLATLVEKIPGFHDLYLYALSALPTEIANRIKPDHESGPSKSRVASVLFDIETKKNTLPSLSILSTCENLHAEEMNSRAPHWASLSNVVQIWTHTCDYNETEKRIEKLYEKNPKYKNLRIGWVRSMAKQMPLETALQLVKLEIERKQSTNFGLTSILSWWLLEGRTSEAIEIANVAYSAAPSYTGLLTFIANRLIEGFQWELYAQEKPEGLCQNLKQAELILRKEKRKDISSKLLAIKIALYKSRTDEALTMALASKEKERESSLLAREFWLYGFTDLAKKILDKNAYTPPDSRAEERLTSALINLSLGKTEETERELKILHREHFSIASPYAPVYPLNQYLQFRSLERRNAAPENTSHWEVISEQRCSKHKLATKVYARIKESMSVKEEFSNPFSSTN